MPTTFGLKRDGTVQLSPVMVVEWAGPKSRVWSVLWVWAWTAGLLSARREKIRVLSPDQWEEGLKVVPVVGAVDTTGFSLWTRFGRRCIKLDWGREKERRTLEIARPDCTVSVRVSFGCLDVPLPIDYCVGAPSWRWMEDGGSLGQRELLGTLESGCLASLGPGTDLLLGCRSAYPNADGHSVSRWLAPGFVLEGLDRQG